MEKESVVPDVIDVLPEHELKVTYANGVEVSNGNELTPTQVKDEPVLVSWPCDSDGLYTLCMTDPDAPTRADPKLREVKHWLVVNIPGNHIGQGKVLAEYRGSGPPVGTGLHRYVFIVYKQPGPLQTDETFVASKSREGRMCFRIKDFAAKYALGQPVAANFYQAQWDEYVAILQQQTTG
ncbi:Phosphatidylethanolamine-binding protein 1 [Halotydeus destructor]|nr:Phosphatidylethanolamine-binding protein 1 [Halotydeus destructor]